MKKENEYKRFQKPKFVLTNETRFYLATRDITNTDETDLFLIASLYLPIKKGGTLLVPHTEVAAFEDSDSAAVYRDTVSAMGRINAKSGVGQAFEKEIKAFQEMVIFAENDQER